MTKSAAKDSLAVDCKNCEPLMASMDVLVHHSSDDRTRTLLELIEEFKKITDEIKRLRR